MGVITIAAVTSIRIGEREIGDGRPCFVIAEAGVNHNGDVELAKRLVDAAAAAGADAVKFQTWQTDALVADGAPLAGYQRASVGGAAADQRQLLAELELSHDEFRAVERHARERGIVFLSTPDEEASADFLDGLGVPAFKIGSAEVTNLPLLRHVGAKRKPVILSTGMATLAEVRDAVGTLRKAGADELVVLQCTSSYPADPASVNLRVMATLRSELGVPVGFSDHTAGRDVAVAAVALGAVVLEKHLTLDRGMRGPDHASSLEPAELAELVSAGRTVESALGSGEKEPTVAELETREAVRRRLYAKRPLVAGATVAADDLRLLRGGEGIGSERLADVVGRRLAHDLAANEPLRWDALS